MNTVDDDNELGPYDDEPQRRPPPGPSSERRPQGSGPRRTGPAGGSGGILRLAGLVVLGIVLVFFLVLWIDSCSSPSKQSYSAYLNAMQPLAKSSAHVGKEFSKALGTPGLTMEGFQADLASWTQKQQADYVAAQRLRPPGPLQSAHEAALWAFYLRAAALANIASHLRLAKEKHENAAVAGAALADYAKLLSASDVNWEQLYRQPVAVVLTSKNVGDVTVPESRIVASSDMVSAASLATVYQRLSTPSTGGTVTGVHGSRLVSTSVVDNDGTKQLSTSTGTTVYVGPDLVLNVVFQNNGAYPEVQIPVTVSLYGGDKRLDHQRKTISQLAAGAQTTVAFTGLKVGYQAFSRPGSIIVRIRKVPGESTLSDNTATYDVLYRLAPP
jgi:hypothetical protein